MINDQWIDLFNHVTKLTVAFVRTVNAMQNETMSCSLILRVLAIICMVLTLLTAAVSFGGSAGDISR